MDINDIAKKYDKGLYMASSKSIPPKVSQFHIFDENLSVKQNHEMVAEHNNMVDELRKENSKKQSELNRQLETDIIDYIVDNYNLSRQQASTVESFVYREKHAFMCDYFAAIDEYAEFAETLINQKEDL